MGRERVRFFQSEPRCRVPEGKCVVLDGPKTAKASLRTAARHGSVSVTTSEQRNKWFRSCFYSKRWGLKSTQASEGRTLIECPKSFRTEPQHKTLHLLKLHVLKSEVAPYVMLCAASKFRAVQRNFLGWCLKKLNPNSIDECITKMRFQFHKPSWFLATVHIALLTRCSWPYDNQLTGEIGQKNVIPSVRDSIPNVCKSSSKVRKLFSKRPWFRV